MSNLKRVNLTFSPEMLERLKAQSERHGMPMNAYIGHLLLLQEEKDRSAAANKEMLKTLNNDLNLSADLLLEVVKNKNK